MTGEDKGKFPVSSLELTWAILVSYLSGLAGGLIEKQSAAEKMTPAFRSLVIFFFLASAFLYITFTYRLPWLDMFKAPE
ncbi:MAG: hypothetical protein ACUVR0_11605 [Candidatus Aminicenantales bacterium]